MTLYEPLACFASQPGELANSPDTAIDELIPLPKIGKEQRFLVCVNNIYFMSLSFRPPLLYNFLH